MRINVHKAKTHLSQILMQVETGGESVILCRNGKPVAEVIPFKPRKRDPLKMHAELSKGMKINYNPVDPLLKLTCVHEKSIHDLRGLLTKIDIIGDINDHELPGYDQW